MKKYWFRDLELYQGINETLIIKAENEEEAWVLLAQRHRDMNKGAIRYQDAKERYVLCSSSDK